MRFKQSRAPAYALFIAWLFFVYPGAGNAQAYLIDNVVRSSATVDFITAQELKSKIAQNELVTIIDVRSTSSYAASEDKIKGAIHVKLRRLKARLAFPPLKSVPRDSVVVTYCACPSDESSVRAAKVLTDAGFKRVRVLKGGWQEWLKANGQVEARPKAP